MEEEKRIEDLEKQIGYTFQNKELLKTAMTHTSYANEWNCESNEKLEFLGDSILEFVSSEYIYNHYQQLKEGEMTKVRASVVCEESLYKVAKKHNFSDFLYIGKSEKANKGNFRPAILADSVEAVIAAMFFDGGLEVSKRFILDNLKDAVETASHEVGQKDYKTVLQEILQHNGEAKIEYRLLHTDGPDHDKTFYTEVVCNGKVLATGKGKSKKSAEMVAAKIAIEQLKQNK